MQTITATNTVKNIDIHPSWKKALQEEFEQPYMVELQSFLKQEVLAGKKIFPTSKETFAAFNITPFEKVKVVIIGQDPYHGQGQAHGLCFSVPPGVAVPPSLVNIYKELREDLKLTPPQHGNLKSWADQGVLLLNSVLTVEQDKAASHKNRGWEKFTDRVIHALNTDSSPKVFFLWGSYAQQKGAIIDRQKHLVLESVHPSPLSAYRGFFGCKHFSKANNFLIKNKISPISWELPTHAQ
ncbi:MAG: uracil-DNA glycosylase [Bdellovibrionaceae bacterium]|nr:uracil-DNA glycosylase [Pseudobdellovibrionaceae bacterium]